jgi:hypothetical protein
MRLWPFLSPSSKAVSNWLVGVATVLGIVGGITTIGCRRNDVGSIESPERLENVENGTVYDRAVVDLGAPR